MQICKVAKELFFFQDRVSLCNSPDCPGTSSCRPGWPRTHRDSPASAFRALGLKVWATTSWLELFNTPSLVMPSISSSYNQWFPGSVTCVF